MVDTLQFAPFVITLVLSRSCITAAKVFATHADNFRLSQGQRRPQQQIPTMESTSQMWMARGNADTAPMQTQRRMRTSAKCASRDGTVDPAQGRYGPANVMTRLEACPAVARHAAVMLRRYP